MSTNASSSEQNPTDTPRLVGKARQTKKQPCRFYNSKSGCRAGEGCKFSHVANDQVDDADKPQSHNQKQSSSGSGKGPIATDQPKNEPQRRPAPQNVTQSRVVSKPIPKSQVDDPREFQVGQIRRRYSPTEDGTQDGTVFTLRLVPSDPDFPYEMEALECVLTVPTHYPKNARPKLRVTNKEMQKGFQLNIEQGFDEIAASAPNATLLGLMNRLDKDLDGLLSRPMAQTIKIYRNVDAAKQAQPAAVTSAAPQLVSKAPSFVQLSKTYTTEEKTVAQNKRQADIRQLIARLGRLPTFKQHTDGVTFTVPFTPLKKGNLPIALQNINTIRLIVPELYNLVPCKVEFPGVKDDEAAKAAERSFIQRAESDRTGNLIAHVNYMSQHLGAMSQIAAVEKPEPIDAEPTAEASTRTTEADTAAPEADKRDLFALPDRSHIQVIPRPPEWAYARQEGEENWSSDDSYSYDSGDETEEEEEEQHEPDVNAPTTGPAERGILLSFPNLELYGVELLELVSLSITVKCLRCKETQDIERLRNNVNADHTGMKEVHCKKCANSIAAGFRMDLMHANSSRAGYIDLDGCTPMDMLPSTFVPTCSECSTSYTTPGCVSVRGESTLAICRECHRKMTFKIPEVKFLIVSAAAERATRARTGRRIKENLGIVAGQELPKQGRCSHYSKSYRWFRFSCCSKVFACDRCHDEQTDHPNEHANRMICGYCSREQNYRPEDCGICHSVLIGKKGRGFWEGGKGTRDPARMSKKDPRKYKRRPATKPRGS